MQPKYGILVTSALGSALLVASCSLFTRFPDIEATGSSTSSSTGSASSSGTGESACVQKGSCENCFPPGSPCPLGPPSHVFDVVSSDDPPQVSAGLVRLEDAVLSGPVQPPRVRFVGSFYGDGAGVSTTKPFGPITTKTPSGGLLVDEDGTSMAAAGPCSSVVAAGGGVAAGGAVRFKAAAAVPDISLGPSIVIAGAFQGSYLSVFGLSQNCDSANSIGPSLVPATQYSPFLAWVDNTGVLFGHVDGSGHQGFMLDVASYDPASLGEGRVAAIGVADGSVFKDMTLSTTKLFLMTASGPNADSFFHNLDLLPCSGDPWGHLDDVDGAVAVEPQVTPTLPLIWAAGTGCVQAGDVPRGFLGSFATDSNGNYVGRFAAGSVAPRQLGDGAKPFRVMKLALGNDTLVLAGAYEGAPFSGVSAGDAGDLYVLAFTRSTYNNLSEPKWFTRFATASSASKVLDLRVDDGRVFIAGATGALLGVNGNESCVNGLGTRAFVAQLNEATGAIDWARVDGSLPATPAPSSPPRSAAASVALPTVNGDLFTAISTTGELVLDCNGGVTDLSRPSATVRKGSLQ